LLFGDKHMSGPEGIAFYTRAKVVTRRWPRLERADGAGYAFPSSK
jgi:malonate-semialdehyde dehydrogenase (acetylating)/methylmalonate-semialdehyde dehydrogenase